MGYFVLYGFIFLGWILMVSLLFAIFGGALAAILASFLWLYGKCFPPTPVPFNPDVIPKVPEPRKLPGG